MKPSTILYTLPVIVMVIIALLIILDIDSMSWLPLLVLIVGFGGWAYINARTKDDESGPEF